jgi:hypothetical protein
MANIKYLEAFLFEALFFKLILFIFLEAIPAIHSQSFVSNAATKGFPLLSGLGH